MATTAGARATRPAGAGAVRPAQAGATTARSGASAAHPAPAVARARDDASPTAVEPPCGLREQKKRQTRRALHRAALRLVHDEGLEAVATDRIAAEAGVSPRTFFNYFPTKEEAVLGLSADFPQILIDAFAARPADEDPWDSVLAVSRSLVRGDREDRSEDRELLHDVMRRSPELARGMIGFADTIRRAGRAAVADRLVARGLDREEARRRAVVYIDVGMTAISTTMHLSRAEGLTVDDAFAEVARVLDSLGADAGK